MERELLEFYSSKEVRKLAFRRRVSQQQRDSYFLRKFKKYFGEPERIVIMWGANYRQRTTFKGYAPTSSGSG